jgi:hypothetical protein
MAKAIKQAAPKKTATKKGKTSEKPPIKKTGKGGTPVPKGKLYSADHQPSGAAKAAGWAKKLALKDMLELSTGNKFPRSRTAWRKAASQYLGIPEEDISIKMIMEFSLIKKAIESGDPAAFNAVYDRAYGKAKQQGGQQSTLTIRIKAKQND